MSKTWAQPFSICMCRLQVSNYIFNKADIECVSIAVRYVLNGKPYEVLLFFESTVDVDAATLTKILFDSLVAYGLDPKKILSQCYDGAAVMKGYKSGVAKRFQDMVGKPIPYVHCFNHKLRLVIIEIVKQVSGVKEFFDQIQFIYTAFRKPKVKKLYDGTAVKRLLDTRWTGHYDATKAVFENYPQIITTLLKVKSDKKNDMKLDGEDIATCIGLLSVITQKEFVFTLVFMHELLSNLVSVDNTFQRRETGYQRAVPLIESAKSTIADYSKPETKMQNFFL